MKFKNVLLSAATVMATQLYAQIDIIPKPNSVQIQKAVQGFILSEKTVIEYDKQFEKEAKVLQNFIKSDTGLTLVLVEKGGANGKSSIKLEEVTDLTKEAYKLNVTDKGAVLQASAVNGLFYAVQSLRQLIPVEGKLELPACKISDNPRFGWRGMHLDVGRHMFKLEDIKKFIDWMAFHKMNTFHWHLTEDQGWRIEIKKYPKLTEVGGFRKSTPTYPGPADNKRYGGFYTQEQAKELIKYAADRHITVIPEIDMPGHMAAAIAAYPELGNDDIPNYKPEVKSTFGIHGYILSPKESTFEFIDNVLKEVCALFPSEYIHIGGDEAAKGQWKNSKFAQSVIKREGLHSEHELQSYFIKRVEKMLDKYGKKLIGWDEIREGGLSPKATMMQWRGMHHAVASAKEGHDVVIAQNVFTYFNCYQNDIAIELQKTINNRAGDRVTTIAKTYSLDPVAPELRGTEFEKHILGCQGQLWSEYLKTWDKLEYMAFPRFSAMAEVAWTDQDKRNYDEFMTRLPAMLKRFDKAGVNYFDPFNTGKLKTTKDATAETNIPYRDYNYPNLMLDGTERFGFFSNGGVKKDQYIAVKLAKQQKGKISVQTGKYNRRNKKFDRMLENGVLEVSKDGKTFTKLASFKDGKAEGNWDFKYNFIRIRVTKDQRQPLQISEINF